MPRKLNVINDDLDDPIQDLMSKMAEDFEEPVDTPPAPAADQAPSDIKQQQVNDAERMMSMDQVNLDAAMAATDEDVNYFNPPPVADSKGMERYDWKATGFWGGYDQQGGDDVKAAHEIHIAQQKIRKETKVFEKTNIEKHLGKQSDYPQSYDPSVLVREPRQHNRSTVGLINGDLPFDGYDLWNLYEVSCLSYNGVPASGVARMLYSCNNDYIVESKSIKLYFNSFNMSRFGETAGETLRIVQETAITDLSELLQTEVKVDIQPATSPFAPYHTYTDTVRHDTVFATGDRKPDNAKYVTLENVVTIDKIEKYQESPDLLESIQSGMQDIYYHSSLLKSNCKVTHQPDWGDVFIYIKGATAPTPQSLLKYIISFRDENHFHEEICETIYKRLWDKFEPASLGVACYYVRRGGVDINPIRVSTRGLIGRIQHPNSFADKKAHLKLVRQ